MQKILTLFVFGIMVSSTPAQDQEINADKMHLAAMKNPTAQECKFCHPRQYREWSVSPHAYAQLSPVFNTLQAAVVLLSNGTNGDFCVRCHTPVGNILGESVAMNTLERQPIAQEGITCIACHRVNKAYGKVNGRFSLEEGDAKQPIYGASDGKVFREAVADPKFHLDRMEYHREVEKFFQLSRPGFCGTCHDLTTASGFREIEAFSEYKNSPAAQKGISCQDCHMAKTPGVYSGSRESNYTHGPAAVVGGKETPPRKLTNHMFAGPDYPIIHPGIFPHNPAASEMATSDEWLLFDYEKGWGTDEFEDNVSDDDIFPERWADLDDRYDARDIINEQLELLAEYGKQRLQILRNGYHIGEIVTERADEKKGIQFKVQVRNATDGHNVPTSLNIVRMVFLQTTVRDREGTVVFQSGDLDPNGDVRDRHSMYVRNGQLPRDKQLFNLQSKVITRNVKGGEREQVLTVNFSATPLPFTRPATSSSVLMGRPRGTRIHKKSIEPLGHRWAKYKITRNDLNGKAPYKVNIRLIAGMLPVNLIREIQVAGFEYGLSPRDVAEAIIKRHVNLWEYEASINIPDDVSQIKWEQVNRAHDANE